jgi:hypothetical protein
MGGRVESWAGGFLDGRTCAGTDGLRDGRVGEVRLDGRTSV